MSFWADCVKFVRSEVFRSEVVEGRTPLRFEHIELTVPADQENAVYRLNFDPTYCIVSFSVSPGTDSPENAVAFFSYRTNSVQVLQRERIDYPVKYQVDIMYI